MQSVKTMVILVENVLLLLCNENFKTCSTHQHYTNRSRMKRIYINDRLIRVRIVSISKLSFVYCAKRSFS